ncbi:MAG: LysR family transcriptional regulator, partial [Acidobacteriota bacterium]
MKHLRAVDAIVREGTVTAAAERLHLTQPAVSHALGELETRLGVKLFRRRERRMELTPEGRRVLQASEVVLDEIRRAEEDILSYTSGQGGILRVATQCYTCYYWFPKVARQLAEAFPQVTMQIVPEATDDPIAALRAERIDFALVKGVPQQTDIAIEELFSDEFVAIVAPGSPLAQQSWLEPEAFTDQHLLVHNELESSLLMREFLAPAGVRPARVSKLGLSEAIFETVRAGLGISAAPSWLIKDRVAAG